MASSNNECTLPLDQIYFEIGGRSQVRDEAGDVYKLYTDSRWVYSSRTASSESQTFIVEARTGSFADLVRFRLIRDGLPDRCVRAQGVSVTLTSCADDEIQASLYRAFDARMLD
jgi:hypothetical protein